MDDDDYVLPLHPVVGEQVIMFLARDRPEVLLDVFNRLASALAPYVSRKTIMDRTPEARLAGRLFSAENIVRVLLGRFGKNFYEEALSKWQWNSRYWEQLALFVQDGDLDLAIRHARHAVAIEEHPFTWTTLSSLLVRYMEKNRLTSASAFSEITSFLDKVFSYEETHGWNPTPHAYNVLFHAINSYTGFGGALGYEQKDWVVAIAEKCREYFKRDNALQKSVDDALTKI